MQELLSRILASKKAMYAAIPAVAHVVFDLAGVDMTNASLLTLDAFFAMLLVGQLMLDMRWGSSSDGTGLFG